MVVWPVDHHRNPGIFLEFRSFQIEVGKIFIGKVCGIRRGLVLRGVGADQQIRLEVAGGEQLPESVDIRLLRIIAVVKLRIVAEGAADLFQLVAAFRPVFGGSGRFRREEGGRGSRKERRGKQAVLKKFELSVLPVGAADGEKPVRLPAENGELDRLEQVGIEIESEFFQIPTCQFPVVAAGVEKSDSLLGEVLRQPAEFRGFSQFFPSFLRCAKTFAGAVQPVSAAGEKRSEAERGFAQGRKLNLLCFRPCAGEGRRERGEQREQPSFPVRD